MTTDHEGNLYITDTNGEAIRAYDIDADWVSTLAGGSGIDPPVYRDSEQGTVSLLRPRGLVSDGTSLYWGEQTAHTIRQLVIDNLEASTLVGVRGCAGNIDGVGGEGSQDWSGACGDPAIAAFPRIDTPLGGLVYHFPTRSLLFLESGRLRMVR